MRRTDVIAAGVFAGLAVVVTWPLAVNLSSSIPGLAGDNLAFLWNFWWMREALGSGASIFHTPYLFAPGGVDLTLNTHTILPAFVGATLFAPLTVVAAHNVTLLLVLALNGFCTYLLAGRVTADYGARLLAGVVFATSVSITVRLLGHFNLTCAFVLPLFALAFLGVLRGSARAALGTGLVMAVTAFTDYYYLVYEAAMGLCLVMTTVAQWSMVWRPSSRLTRAVSWMAAGGMVLAAGAVAAIVITGGFEWRLGSSIVSMRTTYNPLQMFWILAAVWFVFRFRPAIAIGVRRDWRPAPAIRAAAIAAVVFTLGTAPLLWSALRFVAGGDYVSQQYFWRSDPGGVDLATLVLGNPLHPLWGSGVRRLYAALGLSPIESVAWLGIVPSVLAILALRRHRTIPAVRVWFAMGAGFFLWALGPHLAFGGANTGLMLPEALLRFVPLAANARIPGRAMAVVALAVALLAAIAIARLREGARKPALVLGMCIAGVLVDQIPAPFPLLKLDRPTIYETLRDRPERGSLIELPTGIVTGFGESGAFDRRVLFYQTIHRRPIAGGIVARLPTSTRQLYEGDELLTALIGLSGPRGEASTTSPLPDRGQALERLRADGIAFVMLNRTTAPPALAAYVEQALPLTLAAHEGARSLYVVEALATEPGRPDAR